MGVSELRGLITYLEDLGGLYVHDNWGHKYPGPPSIWGFPNLGAPLFGVLSIEGILLLEGLSSGIPLFSTPPEHNKGTLFGRAGCLNHTKKEKWHYWATKIRNSKNVRQPRLP